MRTRTATTVVLVLAASVLAAAPASAQYGARRLSERATGETYHVEVGGNFWNPSPNMIVSSEQFGIPGTTIDAVGDLGIQQTRFTDLRIVLRPAKKHKFRIQYTPVKYSVQGAVLSRNIDFNGIRYRVGVPVNTDLTWKTWRLGYEYDLFYRDRGFVGLVLDVKHTTVEVNLAAQLIGTEFARARAPIPAIGGIGRFYVLPNVGITFEMTGFKLPNIDEDYKATYVDWDLYGTFNFSDNVGAQVGYRSLDVSYTFERDFGDFGLRGLYFGGVARF
jgi:hypothetical protein